MSVPQHVSLDRLGFPGYLASRAGAITSIRRKTMEVLKPYIHPKTRRPTVGLRDRDGKYRRMALARLILEAFGKPSPKGRRFEPTHRNGDVTDCRLENLFWQKKQGTSDRGKVVKFIKILMKRHDITIDELT